MIYSIEEYIKLIDNKDASVSRRIIHEQIPEIVLSRIIVERPDLKRWVIRNKLVPETILVALSSDEDQDVRYEVATKRKTPLSVLEKLARDPIDSVRCAVAYNAKVSTQILDYLAQDAAPEVAEKAKSRLQEQNLR